MTCKNDRTKRADLPLAQTINNIFGRNPATRPLQQSANGLAAAGHAGTSSASSAGILHLTDEESAKFLRMVAKILRIKRHYELYRLMQEEVQHFIPHQVMLSAWGDFDKWDLALDVISAIPRIRTAQLRGCRIDSRCSINSLIKTLHARWSAYGRRPLLVDNVRREWMKCTMLSCDPQGVMQSMRSVLVHGIQNQRDGLDSLYVVLNSRSNKKAYGLERYYFLADMLIAQIDAAFRKVGALQFAHTAGEDDSLKSFGRLSVREFEIMDLISQGRSNLEVAAFLNISAFTVKNHVHRILRKVGAINRTEAAVKHRQNMEALRTTEDGPSATPQRK